MTTTDAARKRAYLKRKIELAEAALDKLAVQTNPSMMIWDSLERRIECAKGDLRRLDEREAA